MLVELAEELDGDRIGSHLTMRGAFLGFASIEMTSCVNVISFGASVIKRRYMKNGVVLFAVL